MPYSSNSFHAEIVTREIVLDEIAQLRIDAWTANGELPAFIANQDIRNDEHDKHAIHFAVMHEEHPVAAARICIHATAQAGSDPESLQGYEEMLTPPIATLSRLVVHPDFRRLGLGFLLTQARISVARERRCGCIVGCAEQPSRMKQLETLGFNRLGPTKLRYLSYAESFVYMLRMQDKDRS
jgi:GNAT superfamily N-acetyltransferase